MLTDTDWLTNVLLTPCPTVARSLGSAATRLRSWAAAAARSPQPIACRLDGQRAQKPSTSVEAGARAAASHWALSGVGDPPECREPPGATRASPRRQAAPPRRRLRHSPAALSQLEAEHKVFSLELRLGLETE